MGLVRSIGATSIASASSALAAFLLSVLLARLVGPSGQGLTNLMTTSAALITLIGSAGTGLALRLQSRGAPERHSFQAYVAYSGLVAPFAAIFTLGASALISPARWSIAEMAAIAAYGLGAFLSRQVQEGIQAQGSVSRSLWGVVVAYSVNLALLGLAILLASDSLYLALCAAAAGQFAQVVAGVAFTSAASRKIWKPAWDAPCVKSLVTMGWPSLGYSLGMFAVQRVDRLLLVALSSPFAAGLYAVTASLAEAGRLLTAPIGQQLFIRATNSGYDAATKRTYSLVLLFQSVPLGLLALLSDRLIPTLFGPEYLGATELVTWLVIAEFFMGSALLDSRVLLAIASPRRVSALTLVAVAVALAGYLSVIPSHGAIGAAWVTTATYSLYALMLRASVVFADRTSSHELGRAFAEAE